MTKINVKYWKDKKCGMDDHLRPATLEDLAFLNSLEDRTEFVIDLRVRGTRNPKQHRFFWALMQWATDHTDYYANSEDLVTQIKFHLNMVDSIKVHGSDDVMIIPKSLSFEKMEQPEFKNFLDEAIRVISEKLVPNLDEAALTEYYKLIDGTG